MQFKPIEHDINLKQLNTFAIDANAKCFYDAQSIEQMLEDLPQINACQLPILVLGGGSNVLLTNNFCGLVIKVSMCGISVVAENPENIWIKVGAGENWHKFVLYCIAHNYAGIENLSLIPGQMGAAPMQNIGAYGVELKDVFHQLSAIELKTGKQRTFSLEQCQFRYRESIFKKTLKNKYLITDVTLRLSKKHKLNLNYGELAQKLSSMKINQPTIQDVSSAVIQLRQRKLPDPKILGSAGSFFKNPIVNLEQATNLKRKYPQLPTHAMPNQTYKISAGWLIEHCGFKGKRAGQVGVYQHHALILVNHGQGSGRAIAELAEEIQQAVFQRFGLKLQPEVNIIENH